MLSMQLFEMFLLPENRLRNYTQKSTDLQNSRQSQFIKLTSLLIYLNVRSTILDCQKQHSLSDSKIMDICSISMQQP